MTTIAGLVFFIVLLWLAFWQKDMVLYIISAVVTVIVAPLVVSILPGVTVMLIGLAVYQVYLALLSAVQAGGPAKGLSQFKGLWNRGGK